eukprot:scaffold6710_cov267-Chaetoceros_neogracile.AAC.8
MSSIWPYTEISSGKMKTVLLLLFILLFPAIFYLGLCLVGPYVYFSWLMERDLNSIYLAEGICLSGSVLEQWTSTNTITSYHIKVLYEAPGGGMYVKNFKVTGEKQYLIYQLQPTQYQLAQTSIQLIVLPQYPASAIQYSRVDPLEQWTPIDTEKWFTIDTHQLFHVLLSFIWVFGYNIIYMSSWLHLNDRAVALIIACEVCISFVIAFFMAYSKKHSHDEQLQNTMFGATPYDESQEVQQPRPSMPRITYQEIFPHGSYTFCRILQSIVIDYLKCVYGLLFTLGFCLMIVLGAGLWFIPMIDQHMRRRISEQYIANGTVVEGKVVHRFASGWKVRVQYAVTDTSTSNIIWYEKTIARSHLLACRQVQVPDHLRLYILHPDLPCSARFADEIELHDKIYEFKANDKLLLMTFYIHYLYIQQIVCVLLLNAWLGLGWSLSITCAILLGVQLFMGWGFASLRSHRVLKDMIHNATELFDVESDISLKSGFTDNTLSLDDNTTTSEEGLDFESPSLYRRFFQGDILYDKIRPLD